MFPKNKGNAMLKIDLDSSKLTLLQQNPSDIPANLLDSITYINTFIPV